MDPLNPQGPQMADPSMVRTLAAQAEAVWPQELPLVRRYGLPAAARILDAGCGTGEASRRLAEAFPGASVLGVDIVDGSLERARRACAPLGERVRFEHRSIFDLGLRDARFDLVVCRHVLQSIPHAERAIAELVRVARPGGWVHLVAEDYALIQFPAAPGALTLWPDLPVRFGTATGTDLLVGRRAPEILSALGLRDVAVDHVVVDPLRVRRETFAAIWEAWRDGYAEAMGEVCQVPAREVRAEFDRQIAVILDPGQYAAWIVPVVAGRVAEDG